MTHAHRRQPAIDETPHPVPEDTAVLTPARQRPVPKPAHLESERVQRLTVHGHSVITEVSTHDRAQPLACFLNGSVHAPSEFELHFPQLRLQPFTNRLPQHREVPVAPLLPADMREAEEVERLRLPFSAPFPVSDRERSELQKPRFVGMQFQAELPESLGKFHSKLLGIRFVLESDHDVVRVPHDDDIAVRLLSTPCLDPQIKNVMEIDVRQQRRCTAALRSPFLHTDSFSILQHARVQPFLDEPHHAPVRDAMLDELHQPLVRNRIEEAAYVQIEHPVHLLRQQSRVQRIQRVMLASLRTEPVRKAEKVRFVNSVHHLDRSTLNDLVLQRGYSERPQPPIGLGDVHPTYRHGPVRSLLQPMGEVLEIGPKVLAVVPPRLPVHAGRGFPLQAEISRAQRFRGIDVVKERGEPHLLILACCLTYPLQRTGRVAPAQSPGRVLPLRISLGQTSSLHPLRRRLPDIVRGLHRYYRPVRLPAFVHHRRMSSDFPMRPRANSALEERGTSRFPCEVFRYVLGVFDRAGLGCASLYRCIRCCLPLLLTASASRRNRLSRLNTRPAPSPVNASAPPSRAAPHDSGPVWIAIPLPYETFIHYTSSVCPAHKEKPMSSKLSKRFAASRGSALVLAGMLVLVFG